MPGKEDLLSWANSTPDENKKTLINNENTTAFDLENVVFMTGWLIG